MTRVWITGAHAITALGSGRESLADDVFAGRAAIAPHGWSGMPERTRARLAARVPAGAAEAGLEPSKLRRLDRISAMAIACARGAAADAGLVAGAVAPSRIGLSLGTGFGGLGSTAVFHEGLVAGGPARTNPMLFPLTVPNSPAGHVSIELGIRGPDVTFAQLHASAEAAVAHAADQIRLGRADVMLAGGLDDLGPLLYDSLDRLRALSFAGRGGQGEGARPYDATRNGTVAAEGAGMLILESEPHAQARGALRLAEYAASASSGAVASATGFPRDARAIAAVLRAAADQAGRAPALVLGAAAGYPDLDAREAEAIAAAFGSGTTISTPAAQWGSWTTAGGAAMVLLVEAIRRGVIPPLVSTKTPAFPGHYADSTARVKPVESGQVSAVAPGGNIVAVQFSR